MSWAGSFTNQKSPTQTDFAVLLYCGYAEEFNLLEVEVYVINGQPHLTLLQRSWCLIILLFNKGWKYINISLVDDISLSKVVFSKSELSEKDHNIKETTHINKVKKSSNQNIKEFVTQVLWYIKNSRLQKLYLMGFLVKILRLYWILVLVAYLKLLGLSDLRA